jgi:hypothetical protein
MCHPVTHARNSVTHACENVTHHYMNVTHAIENVTRDTATLVTLHYHYYFVGT